jgi:hypothetical protein
MSEKNILPNPLIETTTTEESLFPGVDPIFRSDSELKKKAVPD